MHCKELPGRAKTCREPARCRPGFKYRLLLSLADGRGLRASEVVSLKVCDIDSAQMVIRIEQGKGRKDRYVMLSPDLLGMLRQWWTAARPQGWLFAGRPAINPLVAAQHWHFKSRSKRAPATNNAGLRGDPI